MEQDFHGNFQVHATWVLPFSPVYLTELCLFLYGLKDLTLCTSWQTKLFLTVKTDDIKSGRKHVDQEWLLATQGRMG